MENVPSRLPPPASLLSRQSLRTVPLVLSWMCLWWSVRLFAVSGRPGGGGEFHGVVGVLTHGVSGAGRVPQEEKGFRPVAEELRLYLKILKLQGKHRWDSVVV